MRLSTSTLWVVCIVAVSLPSSTICSVIKGASTQHLASRERYDPKLAEEIINAQQMKADNKHPLTTQYPADWQVTKPKALTDHEQATLKRLIKKAIDIDIPIQKLKSIKVNGAYENVFLPEYGLLIAVINDHADLTAGSKKLDWNEVAARCYYKASVDLHKKKGHPLPLKWIVQFHITNKVTMAALDKAVGKRVGATSVETFRRKGEKAGVFKTLMETPNARGAAHLIVDYPKAMDYRNLEEMRAVADFDPEAAAWDIEEKAKKSGKELSEKEIDAEVKKESTKKNEEYWYWYMFIKFEDSAK